jgi:ADP-heptose:LPS heptosyltransferase
MPLHSPSVLLIRLDAIGDALACTPLLAALRDRGIPVDLVLRPINAGTFSTRAARRIFIAPTIEELRVEDYSDVLVATEKPEGYRLASAVGAPHRVGFVNGWGKPFKTIWARSLLTRAIVRSAGLDPRAPHECEVVWKLGRQLLGERPIPRDPLELAPLVIDRPIARGERIAFQVTDKWERLGMRFEDVVRALRAAASCGALHAIASMHESAYADRIADAASVDVERFGELEPWKESIAAAAAIVAPDSGALHVAGMVGTPVVAVFPPQRNYDLQLARWSPWAAPYRPVKAEGDWPGEVNAGLHALLER